MLMQRQRIAQVTTSPAGSAPAGASRRSQRIKASLFMKSSAVNKAIAFSLNITAYARYKATQKNTRGHGERPRTPHSIHMRTQKVQASAPVNKGLCDRRVPCACVRLCKSLKRRHCFPPWEKNSLAKTNIQQTVDMQLPPNTTTTTPSPNKKNKTIMIIKNSPEISLHSL